MPSVVLVLSEPLARILPCSRARGAKDLMEYAADRRDLEIAALQTQIDAARRDRRAAEQAEEERVQAESILREELKPLLSLCRDGVMKQQAQIKLKAALCVLEDPRVQPAEGLVKIKRMGTLSKLLADVSSGRPTTVVDDTLRQRLEMFIDYVGIDRLDAATPNQQTNAPLPSPAPTEMPDADESTLSDLGDWYKSCRTLSSKVGDDYYAQFENGFGETKEERDPKLTKALAEIRKFKKIDGHLEEVSSKSDERRH